MKTDFLSIPVNIRHRIYRDAGVVQGCCLALAAGDPGEYSPQIPPGGLQVTYSLLQTCKVVNEEVLTLVCAQNTIALVNDHIDYGLLFLRRLTPQQCAVLANVSIHLAEQPRFDQTSRRSAIELLPETRIASWLSTARHVLSNSGQDLNLQLFCHTAGDAITDIVLRPFHEFPGRLKDCRLELDNRKGEHHYRVQRLAGEAASRVKGLEPSSRSRPFRFFDLPAEIRRQILMLTDLVTPFNEVYWSSKEGFSIKSVLNACRDEPTDWSMIRIHDRIHHACPFLFCEGNGSPETEYYRCCRRREEEEIETFHYFQDYHLGRLATYSCCFSTGNVCCRFRSGFSSRCKCWTPPTSLLVANRRLYHEAIQILYSCNRIIVLPSDDFRSAIGPLLKRLDISAFITRHMWPEVLQHLRNLECVFPAINPLHTEDLSKSPYFLDFCFALDQLASQAGISKLTVSVYLTVISSVLTDDMEWFHRELSLRDTPSALHAHAQLLKPFERLRGMKAFFVNLEWGWRYCLYTSVKQNVPSQEMAILDAEIDRLETWLEQMVMGGSYDPISEGKLKRDPSTWLYRLRVNFSYGTWACNYPAGRRYVL